MQLSLFCGLLLSLVTLPVRAEWYNDTQQKMGTRIEIQIWAENEAVARPLIAAGMGEFDRIESAAQGCITGRATIDAHSFVVAQQMRRGIQANAIASIAQHAFEHGAAGTFAIGTGDENDRTGFLLA